MYGYDDINSSVSRPLKDFNNEKLATHITEIHTKHI